MRTSSRRRSSGRSAPPPCRGRTARGAGNVLLLVAMAAAAGCLPTTTAAAAPSQGGGQQQQQMYFGRLQVVAVHGLNERRGAAPVMTQAALSARHEHHLNLKLPGGGLRRLVLPAELPRLPRSGSRVLVTAQPMDACGGSGGSKSGGGSDAICVKSMMAHEAAARDVYTQGQPRGALHVKMLVMQLDVCGRGIATHDWAALRQAIWVGKNRTANKYGGRTVEGMFKGCSFGMATVSEDMGSRVLQVPVPVPCAGRTPDGTIFNSSECPFNEWSDVANEWVRGNVKDLKLEDYPFRVYLVPGGDVCGWGGMGYVGCYDDCRAWVNGDLWDEPTTYFHEISHNFYLNHAGKWGNEGYDDLSGAMGFCCDVRCHNAPHSLQLGWAGPVKSLHKGNFPPGTWLTYLLPPAASAPRNFVRVWPDWSKKGAKSRVYLQYRKAVAYDRELPPSPTGFADAVMVYSADAADPQPFTSWEAGIGERQQWREARLASNLVVRVPRLVNGSAEVRLCRWTEANETSCGDGLDNDCDGRVDAADSDCQRGGAGTGGSSGSGSSGSGSSGGGGGGAAATAAAAAAPPTGGDAGLLGLFG